MIQGLKRITVYGLSIRIDALIWNDIEVRKTLLEVIYLSGRQTSLVERAGSTTPSNGHWWRMDKKRLHPETRRARDMRGKMKIKVFGERNTSTRALTQMLRNNSRSNFFPGTLKELSPLKAKAVSLLQRMGYPNACRETIVDKVFQNRHVLEQWKHTATHFQVDSSLDGVHFVFVVRDPRSWLIGFFKRPYHILVDKPATLTEFADLEWRIVARDRLPERTYSPLELYASKLQSYLEFINSLERENRSYSVINFEDFVAGQRNVFDALRPYLSTPTDTFAELTQSTKDASKDARYYADYYAKERWRSDFPEIDAVKLPDNSSVFRAFGYSF